MSDSLSDGRRFRVLTIVDDYSRESVYIGARFRFTGDDVARILNHLKDTRGLPKSLRVDNGPEFTSVTLDQWAYWNNVRLDFSTPGRPTDNAVIESFNARLRQECLNAHWFSSMEDVAEYIRIWRAIVPWAILPQTSLPKSHQTAQKPGEISQSTWTKYGERKKKPHYSHDS